MAVPRDPTVRAAARWLEHLPGSGSARLRALFASSPQYSDLTPTQYADALAWLRRVGLVDARDRPTEQAGSAPKAQLAVFQAAIEHSSAPWLANADQLVRSPGELPEDALSAAQALHLDYDEAFAVVRRAWGKVDTAERERIGAAGEAALVELLSSAGVGGLQHVAAFADGYGYDIAVADRQVTAHLEVKATTSRTQLRIFLSRNEYETMQRDPHWTLAAVRLNRDLRLAAVGWVSREWILQAAPADQDAAGRWESARLTVPPAAIGSGLPAFAAITDPVSSPALHGEPAWPG